MATVQLVNSTDNECAFSAEISAVSKSSLRKTSIIIAENKGRMLSFPPQLAKLKINRLFWMTAQIDVFLISP